MIWASRFAAPLRAPEVRMGLLASGYPLHHLRALVRYGGSATIPLAKMP
jgi:hypothetical protein